MMKQPIFQVNAFTSTLYTGNPAAVCPLEYWLDDAAMQLIARENNLSETVFIVRDDQDRVILSGYGQLYLQGEICVPSVQKEVVHGA